MKRLIPAVLLSSLTTFVALGAGDVLQQLNVSKADAGKEVVESFAYGYVNVSRVRNVFRSASPSARAAMVEQALAWTKAYVSSPQFAKAYAEHREASKPIADEQQTTSIDEELKQRRAQRAAELAEAKKNVAEMPAEYRKAAEEGLKAAEAAAKQYDTAEFRKMERDALVMERQQAAGDYKEQLEKWENDLPADPKALVRKRLQEFLDATADVDFDAKLVAKNGKQRFANAAYEQKPSEWKLAYRAGREATAAARTFAEEWLGEL